MAKFGYTQSQWDRAKEEATEAMIARAKVRGMLTYTDLTRAISAIRFNPEDYALADLLGEIATDEDAAGRGMLTVLVVHKVGDMEPGRGFYELARQLGRTITDPVKFWIEELHFVHATWAPTGRLPASTV